MQDSSQGVLSLSASPANRLQALLRGRTATGMPCGLTTQASSASS